MMPSMKRYVLRVEHDPPVQIKAWKKEFLDNKASVFGSEGSSKTKREKEQLNKQEQELFEQIGRLKMENEWLKKKVL
jgi:hypothetical protein